MNLSTLTTQELSDMIEHLDRQVVFLLRIEDRTTEQNDELNRLRIERNKTFSERLARN